MRRAPWVVLKAPEDWRTPRRFAHSEAMDRQGLGREIVLGLQSIRIARQHRALPWIGGQPIADLGAFGVVGVDFEDFLVMLAREP
jgi:hypothetical protein